MPADACANESGACRVQTPPNLVDSRFENACYGQNQSGPTITQPRVRQL